MNSDDNIPGLEGLPKEWLGKMRQILEAADEQLPEDMASRHPCVSIDLPPDEFAKRCMALMVGKHLLLRRGPLLGTVDEDGEWLDMTADRLRTWLPSVAGIIPYKHFEKGSGTPIKTGIPVELARAFLASDEVRIKASELLGINTVRLPVLREAKNDAGKLAIELLPHGYDPEAKVYTVHQTPDFDEEMTIETARAYFGSLLQYFAWSDENRMSVQIAAMMTIFCRGIFSGSAPMFLWNSNLAGSGKSRLSQLALDPVFGSAGASSYSYDSREEVLKELNASAQDQSAYIWFDDVPPGKVRNTDLNRWITAKTWRCRIIGTRYIFKGPVRAATFMTGAQVELDPMIARRSLIIDLFPRQKARDRVLPDDAIPIDDAFFDSGSTRGKVLGAMWALVRHWDQVGRPGLKDLEATKGERLLESFEGWSLVVPAIVAACDFGNCLAKFEAPDTGDVESREFQKLAEVLIKENAFDEDGNPRDVTSVTMDQVVAAARLNDLFSRVLGSLDDIVSDLGRSPKWQWDKPPFDTDDNDKEAMHEWHRICAASWTDKKIQSAWGHKWSKAAVAGLYFSVGGEEWEFGKRESSRKARFPITRMK